MIFFNIFNIFNLGLKPKAKISVVPLGLWGMGFELLHLWCSWVETQGNGIGRPAGTLGVITRITKSHRDDRYHNFGIHSDEIKEKQAIKVP